jgi:hypothetical protein
MCGRFTLRSNASDLVEVFTLLREPELTPRFNIAPTTQVAVVRQDGKHRELVSMRWGLVPSWSKDPKAGAPLINARGEADVLSLILADLAPLRRLIGFDELGPARDADEAGHCHMTLQFGSAPCRWSEMTAIILRRVGERR